MGNGERMTKLETMTKAEIRRPKSERRPKPEGRILKPVGFSAALPVLTPDGEFLARYSAAGLCGLEFPSGTGGSKRQRIRQRLRQSWECTSESGRSNLDEAAAKL